jgi:hypothetical protein
VRYTDAYANGYSHSNSNADSNRHGHSDSDGNSYSDCDRDNNTGANGHAAGYTDATAASNAPTASLVRHIFGTVTGTRETISRVLRLPRIEFLGPCRYGF